MFVEKISGAKANAKRSELLNMVAYVEVNAIDKVLDLYISKPMSYTVVIKKAERVFQLSPFQYPEPAAEVRSTRTTTNLAQTLGRAINTTMFVQPLIKVSTAAVDIWY